MFYIFNTILIIFLKYFENSNLIQDHYKPYQLLKCHKNKNLMKLKYFESCNLINLYYNDNKTSYYALSIFQNTMK